MDFDQDIYDEAIIEIAELVESVLSEFIEVEKNKNIKIDDEKYNLILRQIHSIKGNSGMIGLDEQYKIVHKLETFLINTYKEVGLTSGIVDLMIDFWHNFSDSLSDTTKKKSQTLHLYSDCFDCLRKSNFKSVCDIHYDEHKSCSLIPVSKTIAEEQNVLTNEGEILENYVADEKVTCKNVLTIGNCGKLNDLLISSGVKFSNFNTINEVYRDHKELHQVNLIYVDMSSLVDNPFVLQHVFKFLKKNTEFIYLLDDKKDLSFFLDDIDLINFSFRVQSNSSKSFNSEISQQLKESDKDNAA